MKLTAVDAPADGAMLLTATFHIERRVVFVSIAYFLDGLLVHPRSATNGPLTTSCRGGASSVMRSASEGSSGFVSAAWG